MLESRFQPVQAHISVKPNIRWTTDGTGSTLAHAATPGGHGPGRHPPAKAGTPV